jgi:hypothetical protein
MKRLIAIVALTSSILIFAGCSASGPSSSELKASIPAGYTDGGNGISFKAGETYRSTNQHPDACNPLGSGWQCLDISYYAYEDCELAVSALGTENDFDTNKVINDSLPNDIFQEPTASAGDKGVFTISQNHSPNSQYNDGYWVVTGLTCN